MKNYGAVRYKKSDPNYIITCYADFRGYAISVFKTFRNPEKKLHFQGIKHSDVVSNKAILGIIQGYIDQLIEKKKIGRYQIDVYVNNNKSLFTCLKHFLHFHNSVTILENFDVEESIYLLSTSINEGDFCIAKEAVKEDILKDVQNFDPNEVDRRVYSLLIGVQFLQKRGRSFQQLCLTSGKVIDPKKKYPFGKPNLADVIRLFE